MYTKWVSNRADSLWSQRHLKRIFVAHSPNAKVYWQLERPHVKIDKRKLFIPEIQFRRRDRVYLLQQQVIGDQLSKLWLRFQMKNLPPLQRKIVRPAFFNQNLYKMGIATIAISQQIEGLIWENDRNGFTQLPTHRVPTSFIVFYIHFLHPNRWKKKLFKWILVAILLWEMSEK